MASRNEGLTDILVQLAANSAQLIEKARASGLFKPAPGDAGSAGGVEIEGTLVTDAPAPAALQAIIVDQAVKIHALEAEVARLKAVVDGLTLALSERAVARAAKPAAKKSAAKKPAADKA